MLNNPFLSTNRRNRTRTRLSKARTLLGQAARHDWQHGHIDHRLARGDQALIVLACTCAGTRAQSTRTVKPTKRAFHNPTMRKYLEALGGVTPLDDLQDPVAGLLHPVDQSAGIAAVRPNPLQTGRAVLHRREHQARPIPVPWTPARAGWTSPVETTTFKIMPSVSTSRCRLIPFTFLPAS